jgi:hypothetical protein
MVTSKEEFQPFKVRGYEEFWVSSPKPENVRE